MAKRKKAIVKTNPSNYPPIKDQLRLLLSLSLVFLSIILFSNYVSIRYPSHELQESKTSISASPKQESPIRVAEGLLKGSKISEPPVRIVIPSSDIDISVTQSEIKDGYWETSENTASYGLGSAYPGQVGNSVIFAHARQGLFYNLKELEKSDLIYVLTSKRWYGYKVSDIKTVFPDQVEVISPTKEERLTLYTCSGFADKKRLIVVAKPAKVNLQSLNKMLNGGS